MSQGREVDADRRLTVAFADAVRQLAADPDDQYLALEKVVIGLFLVEAKIQGGNADSKQTEPLLAGCRSKAAKSDREVMDLCAVVSTRVAATAGRQDLSALEYLRHNRLRLNRTHRSPRWGIDFSQACSSQSCGITTGTRMGSVAHN